jgi:hypothetical protein
MYTETGLRPGCIEHCGTNGAAGIGFEGLPPEQHSWNFVGCVDGDAVNDGSVDGQGGIIQALFSPGTTCGYEEGVILDGSGGYVSLDSFVWGGESSLEIYVKIDKTSPNSLGLIDFHDVGATGSPASRSYLGINDKGRLIFTSMTTK